MEIVTGCLKLKRCKNLVEYLLVLAGHMLKLVLGFSATFQDNLSHEKLDDAVEDFEGRWVVAVHFGDPQLAILILDVLPKVCVV